MVTDWSKYSIPALDFGKRQIPNPPKPNPCKTFSDGDNLLIQQKASNTCGIRDTAAIFDSFTKTPTDCRNQTLKTRSKERPNHKSRCVNGLASFPA
jgi:hypothetical protein